MLDGFTQIAAWLREQYAGLTPLPAGRVASGRIAATRRRRT
jgi:hypothetical protein